MALGRPQDHFESGDIMAVPKKRTSKSRKGMRRSHDALTGPTLSTDPVSGEKHHRHHVSAEGFYRGKKVVDSAED